MNLQRTLLMCAVLLFAAVSSSKAWGRGWEACIWLTDKHGGLLCKEDMRTQAEAEAFLVSASPRVKDLNKVRTQIDTTNGRVYYRLTTEKLGSVGVTVPTYDADRLMADRTREYPLAYSSRDAMTAALEARIPTWRASMGCPLGISGYTNHRESGWSHSNRPDMAQYGWVGEHRFERTVVVYSHAPDQFGNCGPRLESHDANDYESRLYYCEDPLYGFPGGEIPPSHCIPAFWAEIQGPLDECDTESCVEAVGNPITVTSGRKRYSANDGAFEGIPLGRTYSSFPTRLDSALPANWSFSFLARMTPRQTYVGGDGKACRLYGAFEGHHYCKGAPDSPVVQVGTEWERRSPGGSREVFNSEGQLIRLVRGGATYTVEREAGRVVGLASETGRKLRFRYGEKYVSAIYTDDGSVMLEYSYDGLNRLAEARSAGQLIARYRYENPAFEDLLTSVVSADGSLLSEYRYDEYGRATYTKSPEGEFVVDYSDDASSVRVESGRGSATYAYVDTASGRRVTSVVRSGGLSQSLSWSYGSLVSTTEGRVQTRYTRSSGLISRKEVLVDGNLERKDETIWNHAWGVPARVTKYNRNGSALSQLNRVFNASGQVTEVSTSGNGAPLAQVSRFAFCEQVGLNAGTCLRVGLLLSQDGPRTDISDIIRYTYYPSDAPGCETSSVTCAFRKGDLWAVENAMGHIAETLRYDGAGRVLQTKDANGVITDLEYHPRGWLTARKVRGSNDASESDDAIMRIDYWPTGLVKQVTQPDGTFTAYGYDDAHRLTSIADNAGNKIEYTLDNAGNRTKEDTKDAQGALKRTLSRVFNQLGQMQTAKDAYAAPTGFTYDAAGNTNTVTDAKARITDNDYDPLNRLTRTLQDTAGINAETKFEYDALDNLTKVVDPKGLATTYTYNGLGDLTQLSSPDTGVTTYTYDSAGNRASQADARGVTTQYLYDALNRLTQILYPTNSLNVGYTYDAVNGVCAAGETFALGRLTRMADGSGHTQYCYDRFGQMVRKVQTTNGKILATRYAYNLAGRLTRMVYPSGLQVDYGLNSLGQPASVIVTRPGQVPEVLLREVKYHAFGPVAEIAYGTNGRVQKRQLDDNYRPLVIQDGTSLNLGFDWDEVGHLVQLLDTNPANALSTPQRNYRYDALGRLDRTQNAATNAILQTYTYDATGNRTSLRSGTAPVQAYTYPATSHRLSQAGTVARTYDAVGNTTQIGGTAREFVFDASNRMSQFKKSGAVNMNYAYNGRGERVRRFATATSTAQTYSAYDEAGHWIGEYSNTGAAKQEIIWLDDLPVGLYAPTPSSATVFQLYHVQADHLGTPRTIVDPNRNVAVWNWALTGEAFGNSTPTQDPDADGKTLVFDMRFPGQRYDSATQLNYNYFRDYDTTTGRYVESDPIGLNGGRNTFLYSSASPFQGVDPRGLLSYGPTCSAAQQAVMNAEIVQLANEIAQQASTQQCDRGGCDMELARDVMDFIAREAIFNCNLNEPCGAIEGLDRNVSVFGPYILAPSAAAVASPGQCGCVRSTLFHEAAHKVRFDMDEDPIRRETLKCVSCGTNVKQFGGKL